MASIFQLKQRIPTKKCCPCTVNIVCHVRQSIIGCRSSRKGGEVSKKNIETVGRWRSPRRKRCSASKTGDLVKRWDKCLNLCGDYVAQCGLFTHKSVPVIFEPPCVSTFKTLHSNHTVNVLFLQRTEIISVNSISSLVFLTENGFNKA